MEKKSQGDKLGLQPWQEMENRNESCSNDNYLSHQAIYVLNLCIMVLSSKGALYMSAWALFIWKYVVQEGAPKGGKHGIIIFIHEGALRGCGSSD